MEFSSTKELYVLRATRLVSRDGEPEVWEEPTEHLYPDRVSLLTGRKAHLMSEDRAMTLNRTYVEENRANGKVPRYEIVDVRVEVFTTSATWTPVLLDFHSVR